MNTARIYLLTTIIIGYLFLPHISLAQPVTGSMKQAYDAFNALQPYLANSQEFSNPDNNDQIIDLIRTIRSNFHGAQSFKNSYSSQPGFKQNLTIISDLLDDAFNRFSEGKKEYTRWRLRAAANNCFSCHSTYHVDLKFQDEKNPLLSNTNDQIDFYLATRQIDKAKSALLAQINDPTYDIKRLQVIRKWLVLETRTNANPNEAISFLNQFKDHANLPQAEKEEISQWVSALKRWQAEKPATKTSVANAANLIKHATKVDNFALIDIDEVAFLRAVAMLHSLLADNKLPSAQRSQALLLLGYSYTKLPLFFIDELPEVYLEECIEDYPGTADAKECYQIFKDKIELDATGSAGTNVPSEEIARIKELRDKAYGVPSLDGKI